MLFQNAEFSDDAKVSFNDAQFTGGTIIFSKAKFLGGKVDSAAPSSPAAT